MDIEVEVEVVVGAPVVGEVAANASAGVVGGGMAGVGGAGEKKEEVGAGEGVAGLVTSVEA